MARTRKSLGKCSVAQLKHTGSLPLIQSHENKENIPTSTRKHAPQADLQHKIKVQNARQRVLHLEKQRGQLKESIKKIKGEKLAKSKKLICIQACEIQRGAEEAKVRKLLEQEREESKRVKELAGRQWSEIRALKKRLLYADKHRSNAVQKA